MEKRPSNSAVFWGVVLSSVGLLLLMRNFNLLNFKIPNDLIGWRLIPLIVGVNAFFRGKTIHGIIGVGLAVIFYIPEFLSDSQVDFYHKLWPLLMIGFGVFVFANKLFPGFEKTFTNELVTEGEFDKIQESAFMGGSMTKVTSKNFVGGKINTVWGGIEIDLRGADIVDNATIETFTLMGGVELIIPKEWNVRLDVFPLMGGVDDDIKKYPTDVVDESKKLLIKGTVIMGGVGIKRI